MSGDDLKARRFGQHTPDELERARAFAIAAIETYGDFDAPQWAQFHAHGIWNDHAAVQSALTAIMDEADRIALEAEVERLREVVEPFAKALDDWGDEPEQSDRRNLYEHPAAIGIGLGDLRRARAALKDTDHANQENPDAG